MFCDERETKVNKRVMTKNQCFILVTKYVFVTTKEVASPHAMHWFRFCQRPRPRVSQATHLPLLPLRLPKKQKKKRSQIEIRRTKDKVRSLPSSALVPTFVV